MRPAKVQTRLHKLAGSSEPSLLVYTYYGSGRNLGFNPHCIAEHVRFKNKIAHMNIISIESRVLAHLITIEEIQL